MKKLFLSIATLFISAISFAQCAAGYTFVTDTINYTGNVVLTNTSTGGAAGYTTYLWSFGDGTSFTSYVDSTQAVHTFGTGTWYVCLTLIDSANSCTSSFCDSVTVINNTLPGCTASYSYFADSTGNVYFTNTSAGTGNTFSWTFGDGGTAITASPTHHYASNGTYYACLTISNLFLGCTNTWCDSVVIGNLAGGNGGGTCSASFYSVNDSTGNGVLFYSSVSGSANIYAWSFGDGSTSTTANPQHVYGVAGTYTACLTVTSSTDTACHFTACQNIITGQSGACTAYFSIIHDSINIYNYTIYSYATNNGYTSYLWSFGDGTTSNLQYPTHTYSVTTPVQICLTITDSLAGMITCTANYCDSIWPGHAVNQLTTINVLPGIPTGVATHNAIAESLTNYPNPFTDITTIEYSLKQNSAVELSVVDLLGNKITAIETGNKSAGNYKVNFDGSNISAGIYLLQLKAENKVITKKLVITK